MDSKKSILIRTYLIYIAFFLFGVAIVFQVIRIQFVQGEYWAKEAKAQTVTSRMIEAVRGNIFASDGSLLATSIPQYEVRMDVNTDGLKEDFFKSNIDSLSICLSGLFKDKSAQVYKRELMKARRDGERYHLIKRRVTYHQLKALRKFPIFRNGKYKGGLIYVQDNIRARPFGILAARTIGFSREGIKPVGLEAAYSNDLKGESGKRLMQKIAGGVWMPVNNDNEIEPKDGYDLVSTIDINIQDVAENALLMQLEKNGADHGCVILMEVETGNIKAIANLTRNENGVYQEKYNYAIGESTEPGSTFKLASLMALIEDGFVDINDSVSTNNGTYKFYDRIMRDSHEGGYGKITVGRSFEVSSNVAISKLIFNNYSKNPQKFIDRLNAMGLNKKTGLELPGEGAPLIKNTNSKGWSGVTLPWMSIGYELHLTPMQILTFYNAVANNGKMVKPKFGKEIRKRGKVIRTINTEILNEAICSKETIDKAKLMLEGVVQNGTATNLKHAVYKIAAKTGTAQIANAKSGYKGGQISYQASLCGYFPADNPKYSCIVVVNAPSNNVYYGNLVAGPIFREIADKVYSTNLEIHKELDGVPNQIINPLPISKNGYYADLNIVFKKLNIKSSSKEENSEWVLTKTLEESIELNKVTYYADVIPSVVGMGVQDAIYLLENKGLSVRVNGRGVVTKQSIPSGTKIERGSVIFLELS